jgi:hypothetical protein
VLTFWLMAISLKAFGLGHDSSVFASEMTVGWKAEWALRLPFVLLGIVGVWATYHLVRRVVSRRAALWSAVVLGTSTQWALISRQAMTDMAFVAPMTIAVVFAGLALLPLRRDPEDSDSEPLDLSEPLPRKSVTLGRWQLSWPHARAFYVFMLLYVGFVLPQLVFNLLNLESLPGADHRSLLPSGRCRSSATAGGAVSCFAVVVCRGQEPPLHLSVGCLLDGRHCHARQGTCGSGVARDCAGPVSACDRSAQRVFGQSSSRQRTGVGQSAACSAQRAAGVRGRPRDWPRRDDLLVLLRALVRRHADPPRHALLDGADWRQLRSSSAGPSRRSRHL